MNEEVRQYCTFRVDHLFLGIDVRQVQEVIRYQKMTRVPLADPSISGLINLRGQIVTAIDLRRRFALEDRPLDRLPMNVVVRDGDGVVSFLVDEIDEVVEVAAEALEEVPSTLQGPSRALIEGAYQLEGSLLLILDLEEAASEFGSKYPLLSG